MTVTEPARQRAHDDPLLLERDLVDCLDRDEEELAPEAPATHLEQVRLVGKMATFRKVTAAEYLPDWRGEPFIVANSPGVILGSRIL